MNKKIVRKRDIAILALTGAIIAALVLFCLLNRALIADLFRYVVTGKEMVRDYVISLGPLGVAAAMVIMILCFFFPFFSSLPLQIVCCISYGIFPATAMVSASVAIASQILFLLEHNFKVFCYTKKQWERQRELETYIQNSGRSVNLVMLLLYIVPCIPFVVIASIACRCGVKWWKYTLFTVLGPAPEVFLTLVLGDRVVSSSSPEASVAILLFMIALVILSLVFQDKLIYLLFRPRDSKDAGARGKESGR